MSAQLGSTIARRVAAAMLVVTSAAAPAMAQGAGASGGRWAGWIGCWSAAPSDGVSLLAGQTGPLVCITPTSEANVVQVATVSRDSVLSTQRVDASGNPQPMEAKGCTGTQRAHWSADERRVYLESSAVCEGVKRTTSGILAMTSAGEWLDVQSLNAGDGEQMRVVRYHDAGVPASLPPEIASALSGRSMASQSARLAAGADIGDAAVREAVKNASAGVVEAWLLERGQHFALDARELVALADAGVPGRVTDAMVAVSNPDAFEIAHGGAQLQQRAGRVASAEREDDVAGRRVYVTMVPWAWGYDPYYAGLYSGYYGYGRGYSPYGYGYSTGYYGYGYPAYGVGTPIVIVRGSQGETHGKLVKGRGYTPASTASQPQPQPSRSPSTSSPSPRSSSGSSSSGSSSGGSSSSGRTAHERP